MVKLTELLHEIDSVNILVIGDVLLDVYTNGTVDRISPEAPVPVFHISSTSNSIGGAGNVVLNLKALGANADVLGRVGDDLVGKVLKEQFEELGISLSKMYTQKGVKTPQKNRVIAAGQQLIRLDYEEVVPLDQTLEASICSEMKTILNKYDLIAVSDYGKGFLSDTLLHCVMRDAKKLDIPVIVDPKGNDFSKYSGAFLLKPNEKEAYAAAGFALDENVEVIAKKLFLLVDVEHLLVTRSEKGMIHLPKGGKSENFPVAKKDVLDVTGAGDTSLAMLAFGLANGLSFRQIFQLANIASSIAIERLGCAAITLSEVADRILQNDPSNKILTQEAQLSLMKKVMEGHSILLLNLSDENEFSARVMHSIREIVEQKGDAKFVVQIRPSAENDDFIHLLASMREVDFIFSIDVIHESLLSSFNPTRIELSQTVE